MDGPTFYTQVCTDKVHGKKKKIGQKFASFFYYLDYFGNTELYHYNNNSSNLFLRDKDMTSGSNNRNKQSFM